VRANPCARNQSAIRGEHGRSPCSIWVQTSGRPKSPTGQVEAHLLICDSCRTHPAKSTTPGVSMAASPASRFESSLRLEKRRSRSFTPPRPHWKPPCDQAVDRITHMRAHRVGFIQFDQRISLRIRLFIGPIALHLRIAILFKGRSPHKVTCTSSALITGSLARSVIGDRPSHPISVMPDPTARAVSARRA